MILGLDPGTKGAVAWALTPDEGPAGLISLAGHDLIQLYLRIQAISHLVPENEKRVAFIEENSGYIAGVPRTGSSMFVFGRSTGRLEAICAACGFEIHRIRPAVWQRSVGAPKKRPGETSASWKKRLCSFAREICPQLSARITKENSDSVLILSYALRQKFS